SFAGLGAVAMTVPPGVVMPDAALVAPIGGVGVVSGGPAMREAPLERSSGAPGSRRSRAAGALSLGPAPARFVLAAGAKLPSGRGAPGAPGFWDGSKASPRPFAREDAIAALCGRPSPMIWVSGAAPRFCGGLAKGAPCAPP